MNIPDELLTAYVDGELEGAERTRVEQAIAHDARLAQRVAQHRALRERLHRTFDGALHEPVPQRLLNAARLAGPAGPAQIIDLARVRAERSRRGASRTVVPRRVAIAASLLVGLFVGLFIQRLVANEPLTEYRAGALMARGTLAQALNQQLASSTQGVARVQIGLSFRAKSGGYCRTFVVAERRALTGLACREQEQWRIQTLLGTDAANGNASAYRMASSNLPAPLLQAVNERISGEPLDAQAEARARDNGWR